LKDKTLNKVLELFWTRPPNLVHDIFKIPNSRGWCWDTKNIAQCLDKTCGYSGTQMVLKGNISCSVDIHVTYNNSVLKGS